MYNGKPIKAVDRQNVLYSFDLLRMAKLNSTFPSF